MEITAILGVLKSAPEWFVTITVLGAMLISFFFKRKDIDITQMTSISELQTKQLATLIEQNSSLASELHEVRKELSEAYKIINDLKNRISELEDMIRAGRHKEE